MSTPVWLPIGELVAPVATWTPETEAPDQPFTYIDLSAVDQNSKQVVGARRILGAEAPSRARQIVMAGDVLVSTVRPNLNGVARVPPTYREATASTGFCVLRPTRGKIDGSFLFHWVRSPQFVAEMIRRATGASYPAVSDRIVLESKVPLPTLLEQRRIAEVLDRAESLRARRRAALAQLDTLTQAIFLDIFGDPAANPMRWQKCRVADFVAEFRGGKSIEAEVDDVAVTSHRVLKVSAVTGMKYLAAESKPVPDGYEPPDEHHVRAGDLLFSRANTTDLVGAVALVEETPPRMLLPDKLWRFVWREPRLVEPLFVWALFQTPKMRYEIGRRATGTSGSMKNISQEKVMDIQTILPPTEIQRRFAARLVVVERLRATYETSLAELGSLFTALQFRAFCGRL